VLNIAAWEEAPPPTPEHFLPTDCLEEVQSFLPMSVPLCFEVSAKTGEGVEEAFLAAAEAAVERKQYRAPEPSRPQPPTKKSMWNCVMS